jgi:predicted transcriptional regulator
MLETVGLKPIEERVYWTLVRLSAANSAELAERLDITPEQSRAALRCLVGKGLVTRSPTDESRLQAAPPDLAFEPLLRRRQQELRSIEAAVGQMTDAYHSRVGRRHREAPVETLNGARALRHHVTWLWEGATSQAAGFVADAADAALLPWRFPGNGAGVSAAGFGAVGVSAAGDNAAGFGAVGDNAAGGNGAGGNGAGVSAAGDNGAGDKAAEPARSVPAPTRMVYPRQAVESGGDPYRLAEAVRDGACLRLAPVPVTMLIADTTTAIVALRREAEEPGGLLVRGGALLHALVALFEAVWQAALPLWDGGTGESSVDSGGSGVPAPQDRRLLSLLLAGLTDEAIASKMGLSRRTVQRRVRGLIELAGVQTRLQLAWQSARRGWL